MERNEEIINGRKYEVLRSPDMPSGAYIIVGPPEGLIDSLWTSRGLAVPEPFATNLHNILYNRRIFTYKDIASKNAAVGCLMEAIQIDAQLLAGAFASFETEPI